jgi:hypothetical protein
MEQPKTYSDILRETRTMPKVTPTPEIELVVFLFDYKNKEFLQQLQKTLIEINLKCLGIKDGNEQNIRTYKLSESQRNDPKLDYISGVQIMDQHYRTFILEGISSGSMAELASILPKTHANTETFKMMRNETIRFSKRLYSEFNVDLKRIKLRTPIKKLILIPDVYMREKVPLETYRTIDQLNKIRKVNTIEEIVASDLIPGKEALIEFERNYGDALSKEDLQGAVKKKKKTLKGKAGRKNKDSDQD